MLLFPGYYYNWFSWNNYSGLNVVEKKEVFSYERSFNDDVFNFPTESGNQSITSGDS